MTDQQALVWQRWIAEGTAAVVFVGQAQWALRVQTGQPEPTEILLSPAEAAILRGEPRA